MGSLLNSRWRAAIIAAACLALVVTFALGSRAASPDLVISQVYGAGGNTGAVYRNDFVEIFNRGAAPVSLAGKSIQYASATGTGTFSQNPIAMLSGSLAPGQYYLVQLSGGANGAALPPADASGTANLSGSAGKVALVATTAGVACNGGSTPCSAAQLAQIIDLVGYGTANFFEGSGAAPGISSTMAAFRASDGCTDSDNNASDFAAAPPSPRNTSSAPRPCSGGPVPTDPTGTGTANPASAPAATISTLVVAVVPGANPTSTDLAVAVDLSSIGGSAAQQFYDDGTNGDVIADDNIFTYRALIAPATPPGGKSLAATIIDAQARTGSATIVLTVEAPITPIHDIQGPGPRSPLADTVVTVEGIVTGVKNNGFFIQAPDSEGDGNPGTSEGVYVFTGSTPPSLAAIGNLVKVVGRVQEYEADPGWPMTEIAGSPSVTFVSGGHVLPSAVTLTAANMDPAGGLEQLERFEGMRIRVASLTVVGPTLSGGVFHGVVTGVDRPFREPGITLPLPLPDGAPAAVPRFDANPERLRVDSDAIGGRRFDVTSGVVVTDLVGPLDLAYGSYTIDVDPLSPPVLGENAHARAVPAPQAGQFTVASFNMLNFSSSDVTRMDKALLVIRDVMRLPDIIGVEEVTSLGTLQALADKINGDAAANGPGYRAYLEPGNDISGINVGFLVKGSIVVDSVEQMGKDATFADPRTGLPWINSHTGLPELLNDRPPLVLTAKVPDSRGGFFPATVGVNHLRSLSGIDEAADQWHVVVKRRAGAEFLANLLQAHQRAGEYVVSVGDYNAFQFNDGYVDVIGTILGAPTSSDQVLLASADLVNPNFADLVDTADPLERYSYVEDGNAQVLDHVLVSANMMARVARLAYGRTNADFPTSYRTDAARPERVSDHDPVVAYFTFPTADLSVTQTASANPVVSGNTTVYSVTVSNTTDDEAVGLLLTDLLPAGATAVTTTAPAGWTCSTERPIACTAAVLAARATATIEITASFDCGLEDGSKLTNRVTVEAASYDPVPNNNSADLEVKVLNPAPLIGPAAATPATLWPVNHKLVPVTIAFSATDNCDPAPVCSLSVTSNEPTDGRGDGQTATDWQVLDAHHLLLRAERSGTGNGRTYTVTLSCKDATGNTSTQMVVVTVPKSQGQKQ